jgi:uncharacterized protein (TIGR03083 family)
MDHDSYCAEIVTQTELLTAELKGADLRAPVPSCPGWTLGMLLRHLGGGHRWAEAIVRTRATAFSPDDQVRRVEGDDSGDLPAEWLRAGATRLADTLRAAGPDTSVWTPLQRPGSTAFWARRFAHETVIHRADADLAAGVAFTLAREVARDAVDEWMELGSLPEHLAIDPGLRDLLGPGRTLGLQATDTVATWLVDLTGEQITWRRTPEPAAVTVRAGLTALLLMIYRRTSVPAPDVEISGDGDLLHLWLDHVGFG